MPKQIFKNRVIAIAGKPPESITLQNLRTWIPLRKGRFAEAFDEEVTHLLSVQNKRLPEREYSMRAILSKQRAAQREKNRLESGRRLAERYINPNLFHVYHDREFFSYQIELTRDYCDDDEFVERYILTLWESNAKPHLYWFTIKIMRRRGDPNAAYHRISPCSGKWRQEMDHFMEFFKKKTKIPWPQRVLLEGTTDRTVFQYAPPKGGKPVGRRLCLSYDHCIDLNMRLRKTQEPKAAVSEAGEERSEGTTDATDATDATKNNVGDCDSAR
ncbi:hypothetical protein NLG97_g6391 [Lecanicillium saksenae]|uniref:Uncharacterized protein n=1 Tax=Lecanicillium saksenae TaxID=468837 RepID=A0ACC1QPW3_9HYPO|nr:hypothetical protein NLG97_g6391 [Lecanicillium saksenae]